MTIYLSVAKYEGLTISATFRTFSPLIWSLRSEKQMDIKLFTESSKKKNDPSKNMALMEDSFSSYGTK